MPRSGLLPKNIAPKLYRINIRPNLNKGTFTGSTSIDLNVLSNQKQMQFNSVGLLYNRVKVSQNGKEVYLWDKNESEEESAFKNNEEDEILSISADLQKGEAKIDFEYSGFINDELKGFYKAKYQDSTGKPQLMGVTQFEVPDARRAFPCWDEPSFKAQYEVIIDLPAEDNMRALSNMSLEKKPAVWSSNGESFRRFKFERSPIMSSYLVAFVIGNLESIERKSGKTLVRVFTESSKIGKAQFALEAAAKFLKYFEEYFKVEYPISKLDLVAVPDFAAGAMENWGLVTFRDTCILCDEKSSQKAKERVAIVVSHELAHQWFGNLVTMQWWTHLWLNEGFASFMEIQATDKIFPEWKILSEFVSEQRAYALHLDSYDSSHPVEVEVAHPREIDEIFDAISYEKGALIVRMAHDYVGPEAFKKGLTNYIRKFEFKNAVTEDLWHELGNASGLDVAGAMKEFTSVKGFPYLTVTSAKDEKLSLEQSKFYTRTSLEKGETELLWKIPVTTANGDKVLMSSRKMEIDAPENFEINPNASGYYRTLYDDDIIRKIDLNKLLPMNLFSLLNDYYGMSILGNQCSIKSLMSLLSKFANGSVTNLTTNDVVVWKEVCLVLNGLLRTFQKSKDKKLERLMIAFGTAILQPKFEYLEKIKDTKLEMKKLHSETFDALANFEFSPVVDNCKEMFKNYIEKSEKIDNDLKGTVFKVGVKYGTKKNCNDLSEKALNSEDSQEKIYALRALGNAKDRNILENLIASYKDGSVRTQDYGYLLNSISASGPLGVDLVWKSIQQDYERIEKTFKGSLFNDFIRALKAFSTVEKIEEIQRFFADKNTLAFKRNLEQTIEAIGITADFLKESKEDAKSWLNDAALKDYYVLRY